MFIGWNTPLTCPSFRKYCFSWFDLKLNNISIELNQCAQYEHYCYYFGWIFSMFLLFFLIGRPTFEFPNPIAHLPQSPGNRVMFPTSLIYPIYVYHGWSTDLFIVDMMQLSYMLVDLIIWWIIRGHINDIRKRKLKLPPISYFSTYYGSIYHLPTTYMWSHHVLPKPKGRSKNFLQW